MFHRLNTGHSGAGCYPVAKATTAAPCSRNRAQIYKTMNRFKLLIFIIVATLLFTTGCKKDPNNDSASLNADSPKTKTARQLENFKSTLMLKSTGALSIDSSEWYVEGLLNYEKANNDHYLFDLDFMKDSITVSTIGDEIPLEQLVQAYAYFSEKLNAFIAIKNDTSYKADMINLTIKDSQLKSSGSKVIEMEASAGFGGLTGNYILFNSDDYWYWGWNLGKCGQYQGQGAGQDASDLLEYKFNHPLYSLPAGYFTDVDVVLRDYYNYPDPNYPGQYGSYMIFIASGIGENPPEEPCLSPIDLNYYLNKFDYIKNDSKPPLKTFKNVEVEDTLFPADDIWIRLYIYHLFYGIFHEQSGE